SEAALREHAPHYRYLHLATHGFFAPPELRSVLAPRANSRRSQNPLAPAGLLDTAGMSGWPPGLLSGIVLAGANPPPQEGRDDGILTALEVAELDLGKVELATLSACETGLGQVAGGEGLLGLQRAFQVAGAKAVVAGLWKVDDKATRELMERFYQNLWEKKQPRGQALREAQLWLLKEGVKGGLVRVGKEEKKHRTPPHYWAAFVLSGDWR